MTITLGFSSSDELQGAADWIFAPARWAPTHIGWT